MQDSFVFYRSFHEALSELTMEQYGRIMFAINEYALNDTEPELEGFEKMAFLLMKPQIDANKKRRACGLKGGRPKKIKPEEKPAEEQQPQLFDTPAAEPPVATEETPAEPQPAEKPKTKRFRKPTVEEIAAYCKEQGYFINEQRFFDYYESKGWLVGKSPMKDWKAAVRNWNKNNYESHSSYTPRMTSDQDQTQLEEITAYFANTGEGFLNDFESDF